MGSERLVRRLAALAADERGEHHERVAAAMKACRLIHEERLYGLEEHEKPAYGLKRHDGPWYLRREDEKALVFLFWRPHFVGGIEIGRYQELVLPRVHVNHIEWMGDEEKRQRLGCCPGNPVASWFEVAVDI